MKQLIFAFVGLLLAALPVAAQDYAIKPGDTLRIEVAEDASLNRSVLVAPDGRISLPLAGSVQASGQTVDQVRAALVAQLGPSFASAPSVFVGIESLALRGTGVVRTYDVYVIGQAANPGHYEVKRGTTILQFLAQMGGFTDFAATSRIQLRRTDAKGAETVYSLDYASVENGSGTLTGTVAQGDVFIIPPRQLFE